MKKLIFILLFTNICFAQIPKDKQLHFASGFVISGVTSIIIKKEAKHKFIKNLGLSILAGIGKEIYDKKRGGKFDNKDIAYTVAGGLVGTIIIHTKHNKNKVKIF